MVALLSKTENEKYKQFAEILVGSPVENIGE